MSFNQERQNRKPTLQSPYLTSLKLLPCNKYTPQGNIGYEIDTTHFNAKADSIELVTIVLVLSFLASAMSAICNVEVT
jgi:hypothetical protein